MSKFDKYVIVVEREKLFGENHFEGFKPRSEIDFESRILKNLKSMKRGDAEEAPSHKQPIGYTLIVNPHTRKVFAYQRAGNENSGEQRLWNKWSWGVGGHAESIDLTGNPLRESMLREIEEEIDINGEIMKEIKILGYINEEIDSVSQVHFGILYLIEVNGTVSPKDSEIARGEMVSLEEVERICSSAEHNVEGWSKIALGPLKNYFDSIN